jgi:hypothetical protein
MPRNCYECHELFSVKNGFVHFCDTLKNKKGPKISILENRKDIYNFLSKNITNFKFQKNVSLVVTF